MSQGAVLIPGVTPLGGGSVAASPPGPPAISARHVAIWSMASPVAARHVALWSLLAGNPVAARHVAPWSMADTQIELVTPHGAIWIGDTAFDLVEPMEVSIDEGASAWSASLYLEETSYHRLALDDDIEMQVGYTRLTLFIESKQQNDTDTPTYWIGALSPVARFGAPYAVPTTLGTPGLARAVCERLLDQPIDWQIPDWRLPDSAADLEGEPLALVQQIVAVVGGRLESLYDGTLIARPRFPISPAEYVNGAPTGMADHDFGPWSLYSITYSLDAPTIANRFVITSGDDANTGSDPVTLEATATDDGHVWEISAYPYPWRVLGLVHTGDGAVQISPPFDGWREIEELIEISAGSASLGYPCAAVLSTRYQYVDLGRVTVTGRDVRTAAPGHSLLAIRYQTRRWQWWVANPRVEQIQFLCVE